MDHRKPAVWVVLSFVAAHVLVRVLSPHLHYFWETDDPAIAAGVGALMSDGIGDTYRYAPQAGYYRLVQALASLAGGIPAIPSVMVALSTLAGIVVPLLALGAFPRETTPRERFAWALVLAANPILFWSARYGNTAMPSIALVAAAFFFLSRANTLRGEIAGFACFIAAVFVRADAVLVGPALALWLHYRHGALRPVLLRVLGVGAALAAVYGTALLVDPRMRGLLGEVASHVASPLFESHYFDYAVLAFSPVPLFLAIWGMRELIDTRPRLLALLLVWAAPTAAFYFLTLTTPRYFLALAMPLSLCGAIGALELIERAARAVPRAIAALLMVALAGAHLVVPVDRLSPRSPRAVLNQAHVDTHDGPMHTGAFLYHALFQGGFLRWSWRSPEFGAAAPFPQLSRRTLAELAADPRGRRVFIALRGFPEGTFYYELYRAGAVIDAAGGRQASSAEAPFKAPTWWRIGASRILTAQPLSPDFGAMRALPILAGDEIWFTREEDESVILQRVPHDVERIEGPGAPFIAYRAVAREQGGAQ